MFFSESRAAFDLLFFFFRCSRRTGECPLAIREKGKRARRCCRQGGEPDSTTGRTAKGLVASMPQQGKNPATAGAGKAQERVDGEIN